MKVVDKRKGQVTTVEQLTRGDCLNTVAIFISILTICTPFVLRQASISNLLIP